MRNQQHGFHLMVFIAVLSLLFSIAAQSTFAQTKKTDSDGKSQKKVESPDTSNAKSDPGSSEKNENSGSESVSQTPETTQTTAPEKKKTSVWKDITYPILVLLLGISIVLGLIIWFKINAFLALISAAIVVSILAPGPISGKISRVADSLGDAVGGIGIVIALAAIIGKCMLDSGAADRIVRAFLNLLGEKRAPSALLGSGFVLAVPVFFDTVFYLLVPLARSLHRRTGVKYLLYILAIGAGGAITHTLVPPTPGPLLMASNLGVDIGTMIMVGAMVAFPAACCGLLFASIADRIMQTPMRELPGSPEPEPIADDQLPSLWLSLAPVIIPVILISIATVTTTIADNEHAARFRTHDFDQSFVETLKSKSKQGHQVASRVLAHKGLAKSTIDSDDPDLDQVRDGLNKLLRDIKFYDEDSFLGIKLSDTAKSQLKKKGQRMKLADVERLNRALLESAFTKEIEEHEWNTSSRQVANVFGFFGNANFALLISTLIALWTLARQRGLSFSDLAKSTEEALMSAGVIILITAGGAAFGAMLKAAHIGDAIELLFDSGGAEQERVVGYGYLFLGFIIAAVLKIAQGSSTVAMIVGSSMIAAIVGDTVISFHFVYLATAIGAGSLFGSWMNDSGFWIFAKMGGLTEGEALRSWTVMLIVLSLVSLLMTVLLTIINPMAPAIG